MRGRLLLASHITLFISTKSESTVAIWPKAGQDAKNKVFLSEKVREQKQKACVGQHAKVEAKQPFGQQAGHDDGKNKSF